MSTLARIPIDGGETMTVTPAALSSRKAPPSFVLKAPTRREREALEYALIEDGLRRHSEEDIREATIDELCRLWRCGPDSDEVRRVKDYWRATDDYVEEAKNLALESEAAIEAGEEAPAPLAPFEHPDHAAMTDLLDRLGESSAILRRMATDSIRWAKEFPRFAVAHCVTEWTGLDTEARFERGVLTVDSVCAMQDELDDKFGSEGRIAATELATACLRRFYLDRSAEKNSKSPAPSASTPPATKEAGSASSDGKSQASEASPETPAA